MLLRACTGRQSDHREAAGRPAVGQAARPAPVTATRGLRSARSPQAADRAGRISWGWAESGCTTIWDRRSASTTRLRWGSKPCSPRHFKRTRSYIALQKPVDDGPWVRFARALAWRGRRRPRRLL